MKYLIVLPLFFTLCFHAAADKNDVDFPWEIGKAQLRSGEKHEGEIFYDYYNELLIIKSGDKIKTFSPLLVDKFSFYDERLNMFRTFISLSPDRATKMRKTTFFEVALVGEITLLRKQRRVPTLMEGFLADGEFAGESSHLVYYSLYEGKIFKVKNYKKDILPLMEDQSKKIARFINEENIRLHRISGQVKVIMYYNKLKSDGNTVARGN